LLQTPDSEEKNHGESRHIDIYIYIYKFKILIPSFQFDENSI